MLHNPIPNWLLGDSITLLTWRTAQHAARRRAQVRGLRQNVTVHPHHWFRRTFTICDVLEVAEPCS